MKYLEKIKRFLHVFCELLELVVAALMIVGVVTSIVGVVLSRDLYAAMLSDASALTNFIARVFTIVIGIEFLQMLSKPDTDNVIEILVFLVARHMIVGETDPKQDLISVISLTILIILRWVLHDIRRAKEGNRPLLGFLSKAKNVQSPPEE